MPSRSQRIGARGEAEAERYLVALGYRILDRHVTCRYGELDLVATDGVTLLFVEVKLRYSLRFGSPEQSMTARKLRRLAAAIEWYRNAHPDLASFPYQLDLIALDRTGQGELRHVRSLSPDEAAQ